MLNILSINLMVSMDFVSALRISFLVVAELIYWFSPGFRRSPNFDSYDDLNAPICPLDTIPCTLSLIEYVCYIKIKSVQQGIAPLPNRNG